MTRYIYNGERPVCWRKFSIKPGDILEPGHPAIVAGIPGIEEYTEPVAKPTKYAADDDFQPEATFGGIE